MWNPKTKQASPLMDNIFGHLILVTIFAWLNMRFTVFLDFCFNEGNIFDFYYSYLQRLEDKHPKLAKPLGLCGVCMGFWLSFGWWILLVSIAPVSGLFLPIYIVIATTLLMKHFIKDE